MKSRLRPAAAFVNGTWQGDVERWPLQTRPADHGLGRARGGLPLPARSASRPKLNRLKREVDEGRRVPAESSRPQPNERDAGDPGRAAMKRILPHLNQRDRSHAESDLFAPAPRKGKTALVTQARGCLTQRDTPCFTVNFTGRGAGDLPVAFGRAKDHNCSRGGRVGRCGRKRCGVFPSPRSSSGPGHSET